MSDRNDTAGWDLKRVRETTRALVRAVMFDEWPSPAAQVDFGLKSQEHYEALYYPLRNEEITPVQLDGALGNGPKLTELANAAPSNLHKGITFTTDWDRLMKADVVPEFEPVEQDIPRHQPQARDRDNDRERWPTPCRAATPRPARREAVGPFERGGKLPPRSTRDLVFSGASTDPEQSVRDTTRTARRPLMGNKMAEPRHDVPVGRTEVLSPATRALVDHVLPAAAQAAGFEFCGGYGWGRDFWQGTLIHQDGFEAGLYADPPLPTRASAETPAADVAGKRPTGPDPHVWADTFVLHPELTDDEWRVAGPAIQDLKRRRLCEGHYRDEAASPPCYLMIQYPHHGVLAVEPVTLFLFAFVLELYRIRASIPCAELWVPETEHLDRLG